MAPAGLRARFRGVRGSYPVPGRGTLRTGGNTPCVEVRAGGHLLILDGGTGLISMGEELVDSNQAPGHLVVFLSHLHHDHTQGIPFFQPQLRPGWTVHYYGPDTGRELGPSLEELLAPPYFPVRLDELEGAFASGMLGDGDRLVVREPFGEPTLESDDGRPEPGALVLRVFHNPRHPRGGVLNARVEWGARSLVYATDVEGLPGGDPELADFARDTDLLIHDAQYTTAEYESESTQVVGFGHSSAAMAAATAREAGASRLALFHHDPRRDDQGVEALEKEARRVFPESFAAREGEVVELDG